MYGSVEPEKEGYHAHISTEENYPNFPTWNAPLFFLAGPIRGGGDWQCPMSVEIDKWCSEANVAVPSRWTNAHLLRDYFVQPFSQADNRQLVWERYYMKQAALRKPNRPNALSPAAGPGCLMFWFPLESELEPHPGPEPYAMDTRRETGKYAAYLELLGARIVIGGNPHFFGLDVILNEFSDAVGREFPFYETMSELVGAALKEVRT